MTPDRYPIPAAVTRVLAILPLLADHAVTGLTPSEIARAVGTSAPNTTRDLAALQQLGWVEVARTPGRWRLAPRFAQLALHVRRAIDTAAQDAEQQRQRMTRVL